MTAFTDTSFATLPLTSDLGDLRRAAHSVETTLRAAGEQLKADLAAKADAKKQRSPIDELEDKLMATTAIAAAASGTPEQTREMLAKARRKAMQAAADGADTGTLDAMVRQMEHLTKVAEDKRALKSHTHGHAWVPDDSGAAAIRVLTAIAPLRF